MDAQRRSNDLQENEILTFASEFCNQFFTISVVLLFLYMALLVHVGREVFFGDSGVDAVPGNNLVWRRKGCRTAVVGHIVVIVISMIVE